jgi:hypothetical protein
VAIGGGTADAHNPTRNSAPLGAFGLPSSPFANEYVFYEVLIAVADSTVGMAGLRILFGVVNILPFVLVVGIWLKYRRGFRFSYWFALAGRFR